MPGALHGTFEFAAEVSSFNTQISQLEFMDIEVSECNLIKHFKDVKDIFLNFDLDKNSVFKIQIHIFKKKNICI